MFFSVARLRLSILSAFILTTFVNAHDDSIFTSSVSYCSPPESLLIQQFDVAYIAHNRSVNFNISAASVLPNVSVNANLFINVYGMRPFNFTIDLCKLFSGALCPLPTYNFVGADSITLPASVDVPSMIPGIAYKIPDLEAYAQLTLTEVGTGKVRACIQSTLSNGWSTHQKGVEWATGAMSLLALFSALFWSFIRPDSLTPVRLLDLIYLFQTITASGLLGLNYPIVYRAFTSNFAWALGLFSQSSTSSIQHSINHMRNLTGGDVSGSSDAGNAAISLVNRKLSPYNNPDFASRALALRTADISSFLATNASAAKSAVEHASLLVGGQVETVTQESDNVLQAGIPIYVNVLGIVTENAFMTVFFISLILAGIALVVLGLGYTALLYLPRTKWGKQRASGLAASLTSYPPFARAWGLRVVLVCFIPVSTFAFYQWTLKDSWLSILLSVILFFSLLTCIAVSIGFVVRPSVLSRVVPDIDPTQSTTLLPFTSSLRVQRYYYVIPLFIATLVKGLVIAFGQAHGETQAVVMLVVEALMLVVTLVLRPHRSRGADVLASYLSVSRVLCTGPLIAFSETLKLAAIPRVVVGIILAVIWSVAVLVMFFNIIINLGIIRLRKRTQTDATAIASQSPSLEEGKVDGHSEKATTTPAESTVFYQRPTNPSPTHTPMTISAFTPTTPTTTLSHFSEPPSIYSDTTTSSTLGEALPRRWSFQHSRPPSQSIASYAGGLSPRSAITPITPTTESEYVTPRDSLRPPSSS